MADTFEEARLDLVDLQLHRYRGSALFSHYQRDRGILVIPVMGPEGTPPVIARVHAPIGYRTVDFSYAKAGGPPLMPAAANTSSGDIILSEEHKFAAPVTDTHGNLIFGVSGHFTYVQPNGGRGPDNSFPIDSHPFPTAIDALGQYDLSGVSRGLVSNFSGRTLHGVWNQEVVDSRYLSSYTIIG